MSWSTSGTSGMSNNIFDSITWNSGELDKCYRDECLNLIAFGAANSRPFLSLQRTYIAASFIMYILPGARETPNHANVSKMLFFIDQWFTTNFEDPKQEQATLDWTFYVWLNYNVE